MNHNEIALGMERRWTQPWDLPEHTLVAALVGSTAHGTYLPSSDPHHIDDIDILGVFVPPRRYFTGLSAMEHWVWQSEDDPLDVCMYDVRKMARLLLKGNPNVLGMLWQPKSLTVDSHSMWRKWRNQRSIFLSQRVITSFTGYALGQLSRLGKPNTRGYMGKDRKALFAKYGYDIKNAAHCIRLLRMGLELVELGELLVDRTDIDADELKLIKRGEFSLAYIQRLADEGLERLRDAEQHTSLPELPNSTAAERLVMDTVEAFW